ncbi:cyclohexanecarboxyl-CoA dehydrogenase [Williamsia limnetica]|uniref:Cyclohexanecarboxyl-CoA dehydrogenase n=1 Tax=Williamsia limnetica TaxID=882452 RepID=A0A318R9S6_WILLI|nr:acyl-CoA dehydrogenase family protein [Williamsia limnetica]PYE11689.1 cyclohexanecarboxyl-CoA dehydrogenase [Williamsia limnetica]
MVSFEFDEVHQDFAKTLRAFSDQELLPRYRDRAASTDFPFDAYKQLGDLGVLGIGLPEEFGGTGEEDPVLLGLATETLAAGDVNVASAPVQLGLVASQFMHCGREVQERYLPPLISGDETAAIALTEPGSGSDASALRTTATPVPGGWNINGEKTAITWAMNATTALVYARTPGTSRTSGISCFVVPMNEKGVSAHQMLGMGCLPLGWGSIHFDDVFVPTENLVGDEGRGFHAVMGHFDFSRAALGLLCLGAARQSLDEAVAYAQERETFGHPIADYQGISFLIAEHATYLEAARWICYRALWMRATGQPHTALASMGKWWPPVVAKNAIEAAMRIHGNLGYSAEFPLQQRYRDVTAYLVADGTSEIQKRIISKNVFARKTVAL